MAKNDEELDAPDVERIQPSEPQNVTINLDEPEEDEDDEKPVAAKSDKPAERVRDPKTGKWVEKKNERAADHKAKKAWETDREQLTQQWERRIQEVQQQGERRVAELEARMARETRQTGVADPHDQKILDLETQITSELKLIETDEKRGYERYNALRRAEQEAVLDKKLAAFAKGQQVMQQTQKPDPYAARVPIIESEFPWIANPAMKDLAAKARAYADYLIRFEGRPDTLDTDREALSHTQAQFGGAYGLQPPARPTQAQRNGWARPASNGIPGATNGKARMIELPAANLEGSGLSAEALRRALAGE